MRTKAPSRAAWAFVLLCPALSTAQTKAGSLPEAKPKAGESKASDAKPSKSSENKPGKPAEPKPKADKPEAKADTKAEPKPEPKAESKPATDVGRGSGTRSVPPPPAPPPPVEATPAPSKKPEPSASHQKGRPPAKPSPTLPPGAARGVPDKSAREHITGGAPTDDALRRGKDDAELRSLREAERVLFPRPLDGLQLGFDFPAPNASGTEVNATGLPSGVVSEEADGSTNGDRSWLQGLAPPDLPVRYDERVVRYLRFYRDSPSGRGIARTWAKKAGRYAPAIKAELARAGLPSDLVWLSLIESSHNPTIASPAGAAGLWQFMPDAARSYGLTVDRWVDERLDPERSTQAAVRYLSDLYRRFGSWDLSMAAYNMGYGGLSRSVRKFNTNSFWELSRYEAGIPWETTLYVPKILATAIVMNNRRSFGLDGITEDAAERFDVVAVGPSIPLADIARAVGAAPSAIEALNPQFLAGRTPPAAPGAPRGSFRVRVPEGTGKRWTPTQVASDDGLEPYVVRAGETVERIARARGTSERELRERNRVGADEVLAPGTVLLVPRQTRVQEPDPTTESEVVVIPERSVDYPGRRRVFYRVVSGDTTSGVATAFKVTPQELSDWNTLDPKARLEPGMSLQVFVPKDADLSKVLHVPEAHAKILIAGSPEFCGYFEGQNGKKRLVIAAREGDTLASIGKRYGMTIGQMERVNRRGRSDQLSAGERIVVYTERAKVATGDVLLDTNS